MSYTQRLAEARLVPSVGSVGDAYDHALAETIKGLYKTEVIWRQRSWPSASAVEMVTLNWELGRLVQQSPPIRSHRPYPASRGRSPLLCSHQYSRYGGVAQMKPRPEKPGRFTRFTTLIVRDSHPTWLILSRWPITATSFDFQNAYAAEAYRTLRQMP